MYVVSDPSVVAVSTDGLVTSVGLGAATVTVLHGAAEVVVPVRVADSQGGVVPVGASGGVVRGTDGAMVSIGPGALAEEVPVAIAPLAEADLPLPVPNYLTFGAAFNLDLHGASLHEPAQLAVPVPSSFASGTTAYFLRHDILMGPDGNPHPVWIVMDKGTVSADGFARTASPPYPGFSAGGQYLCALHDSPAGLVDLVMSIAGYRPPSSGFRSFAFAIGLGVAVELEGRLPLPNAMQIAMGIWGYSGDHWGSIPLSDAGRHR